MCRIPALARGVVQVECTDEIHNDEIQERPKTASGRDAVWSDAAIETERLHQQLIARIEKRNQIASKVRQLRHRGTSIASNSAVKGAERDGDIAEEIDILRLSDDEEMDDEICDEEIAEDLPFARSPTSDEFIGC